MSALKPNLGHLAKSALKPVMCNRFTWWLFLCLVLVFPSAVHRDVCTQLTCAITDSTWAVCDTLSLRGKTTGHQLIHQQHSPRMRCQICVCVRRVPLFYASGTDVWTFKKDFAKGRTGGNYPYSTTPRGSGWLPDCKQKNQDTQRNFYL